MHKISSLARVNVTNLEKAIESASARLLGASSVLVLTGSGLSAASGLPLLHGPGAVWRGHRPEELHNLEAFERDPRLVWEWFAWRRERAAGCSPSAAHRALAALEERLGERFHLATLNVDGLHSAAGNRRITELHGSIWRFRCLRCRLVREDRRVPLRDLPPVCRCGAHVRPDVVWPGEAPPDAVLHAIFARARGAGFVLVVGTSVTGYPAAALPQLGRAAGAFVVEVNPETTALTPSTDISLRGPASEIVPALVGSGR